MAIHKLSPRKIATAQPGKYEDDGGLRLVVSQSGAKRWVLRFTISGKRKEMGLGSHPDVSLSHAREKASEARQMVKSGTDPILARNQLKASPSPSFTSCAANYIRAHRKGWSNAKHAHQWARTLKMYVRPHLGKMSIDCIKTEHVLSVLSPIWYTKTETAKRVQGRIENILDYAAAHQYRTGENPARWRGHLDKLLPKPSRLKEVRHHPAMSYSELPGFYEELSENRCISALALMFLILTATRTNEVLGAKWSEIDIQKRIWTIPATRMKAKREHRVPLSSSAMDTLKSLARTADNPFLFPGKKRNRPISNMALLQLMKSMGYGTNGSRGHYVPHGFRSTFRDWVGELSNFPSDVAEMALAHVIENKVEAAYRRGDLFLKRTKMMQSWADFLSSNHHRDITSIGSSII